MESKQKKPTSREIDWECEGWLDSFNDLMKIEPIDDYDYVENRKRRKEAWNPSKR